MAIDITYMVSKRNMEITKKRKTGSSQKGGRCKIKIFCYNIMAVHNLDLVFNNLDNIIKDIDENYGEGGNYSNNPLRLLIGRIWEKKMSDLKQLHELENNRIDYSIDDELDTILGQPTIETRRNYDTYIQKIASIKHLLEEQNNDRIVPLNQIVKRIQNNVKLHDKKIKKLEKKLYKIRVGTLEGLTRDTIAKNKITPKNLFQTNLLNPPDSPNDPDYSKYNELSILFPEDVEKGGKRRVSRKYRNNRNKKIRKSKKSK